MKQKGHKEKQGGLVRYKQKEASKMKLQKRELDAKEMLTKQRKILCERAEKHHEMR